MVMPSPTAIAARRIRRATTARRAVVLTGTIAGGGPCHWALEDHIRAGLPAFATPEAALTFDDELDKVEAMGLRLVSDDEAASTGGAHVRLRDLDLDAIRAALAAFDVGGDWEGIAAGCLDHGNAPPGYSDRLFRFDHLRRVIEGENDLRAFAYLPAELPEYLTRARSLVRCLPDGLPAVFLDTGPAAALGALEDPAVRSAGEQLVLNLGNMHALAFHLRGECVLSLFEHHTGEMTTPQIEDFARRLVAGTLRHEEVFASKGHGAFYNEQEQGTWNREQGGRAGEEAGRGKQEAGPKTQMPIVAVTGPQRSRLVGSALQPYMAAPHGDMMISGCFGMVRAFAYRHAGWREEIEAALTR